LTTKKRGKLKKERLDQDFEIIVPCGVQMLAVHLVPDFSNDAFGSVVAHIFHLF
jgi:hypothetical protein